MSANILVVDNDTADRTLLVAMLEKRGYEARPTTSGAAALDAARKCAPDLVLVDTLMPDMDGYEVCAAFKADGVLHDIPIIFLSAVHTPEERAKVFAAGGVDYIIKPLQAEEVLTRINTHLMLQKTQQALEAQHVRLQKEIDERKHAEEALTLNFTAFFPEVEIPRVTDVFTKAVSGEVVQGAELLARKKDGSTIPIEMSVSPIMKDQSIIGVQGIGRDIVDRKQAEEIIAFQANLLDIVEQAIIVTDPAGHITYWNRFAEKLYGWTASEALGQTTLELISSQLSKEQGAEIMARLQVGDSWQGEYLVRHRDGTVFPIWAMVTPSYDQQRQLTVIVGLSFDITDRRRTEDALRESEERYQALIRTAMDGFWVVDQEGQLLDVNDTYCAMSGYTREALLSMRIPDLELIESPEVVAEHIQETISRGWDRFESRHRRADGTEFYAEISAVYLAAQHIFLSFIHDITARKQAEQQLQLALKEKTALLQEIHHRVKNNLQAVSSLLYLQTNKTEHAETRKILQESRDRVLSMALVHEQLYISENLANINMASYINELATNLYHSYQVDIERIKLNIDIAPLMLNIEQAVPCGLLIQELVSNAIKHAFPKGENGTIFINFHSEGDRLRLVVHNTGAPFPPEIDIARADTMGLDLINTFTQQLRGMLELDRNNGTTFTISFPKPLTMNNKHLIIDN